VTLKTPGDGRHSPDGAGRHLAKLVEGLAALLAAGEPPAGRTGSGVSRRQNALDPGFHDVRPGPARTNSDADDARVA